MSKADSITWLATLSEDDIRLAQVEAIRCGMRLEPEEPTMSLKKLAAALGYNATTLHRLKIQRAGERIVPSGRLRYRLRTAREYLQSAECAAVREELRQTRQKQERAKS